MGLEYVLSPSSLTPLIQSQRDLWKSPPGCSWGGLPGWQRHYQLSSTQNALYLHHAATYLAVCSSSCISKSGLLPIFLTLQLLSYTEILMDGLRPWPCISLAFLPWAHSDFEQSLSPYPLVTLPTGLTLDGCEGYYCEANIYHLTPSTEGDIYFSVPGFEAWPCDFFGQRDIGWHGINWDLRCTYMV